jgi:Mg2+-importing ATPase
MESVISASIIVLVIRSRRPFYKSRPGKLLSGATVVVILATLILPLTPVGEIFGFIPLPVSFLVMMGLIVILYILSAEFAKKIFYQRVNL